MLVDIDRFGLDLRGMMGPGTQTVSIRDLVHSILSDDALGPLIGNVIVSAEWPDQLTPYLPAALVRPV